MVKLNIGKHKTAFLKDNLSRPENGPDDRKRGIVSDQKPIDGILRQLTEREERVARFSFGIDVPAHSLTDIARQRYMSGSEREVSVEAVRRIEGRAMRKIKDLGILEEFFDLISAERKLTKREETLRTHWRKEPETPERSRRNPFHPMNKRNREHGLT
jgi:hypothetical protein